MPKSFDTTLNTLLDAHTADWAAFLADRCGVPMGAVTALDTDLSATLQPDRLFRIDGPDPAVLHLELEANGRLGVPRDLLRYNAFVHHHTELPVQSVLILLRPKANATDQTGVYVVPDGRGGESVRFRYTVVRVWQERLADMLAAGPGVSPLALLTNEAAADLPAALVRFHDQLRAARLPDNVMKGLIGASYTLCGLRYDLTQVLRMYQTMSLSLEDSVTVQYLVNKGEIREAQATVIRLGGKRFGPATEAVQASIRGMTELDELRLLADRVLDATGWDDLLAGR